MIQYGSSKVRFISSLLVLALLIQESAWALPLVLPPPAPQQRTTEIIPADRYHLMTPLAVSAIQGSFGRPAEPMLQLLRNDFGPQAEQLLRRPAAARLASRSQTIEAVAETILNQFDRYYERFIETTLAAKDRFEKRDWHGIETARVERLKLYRGEAMEKAILEVSKAFAELHDETVWLEIRDSVEEKVTTRYERDLALTFFYSVMRLYFASSGKPVEYSDDGIVEGGTSPDRVVYTRRIGALREILSETLAAADFKTVAYEDLERDVRNASNKIEELLIRWTGSAGFQSVDFAKPLFFRNKDAYFVGRIVMRGSARIPAEYERQVIRNGEELYIPLLLALENGESGVFVKAKLMGEEDASNLFTYARSDFQVNLENYRELVDFLHTLMPSKNRADLYASIGFIHPSRIEFIKALRSHMEDSGENFMPWDGADSSVMTAFDLKTFPYVFYAIFDTAKAKQIQLNYQEVHESDRGGRALDTLRFQNVRFKQSSFSRATLKILQSGTGAHFEGNDVVFPTLYAQRKIEPLSHYLRRPDISWKMKEQVREGVALAIKDLAAAGFVLDHNTPQKFGVTHHGRVVIHSFEGLKKIHEVRFRDVFDPEAGFGPNDFYPWAQFYDGWTEFSDVFGDEEFFAENEELLTAEYWQEIQRLLASGEILDVNPYSPTRHLQRDARSSGYRRPVIKWKEKFLQRYLPTTRKDKLRSDEFSLELSSDEQVLELLGGLAPYFKYVEVLEHNSNRLRVRLEDQFGYAMSIVLNVQRGRAAVKLGEGVLDAAQASGAKAQANRDAVQKWLKKDGDLDRFLSGRRFESLHVGFVSQSSDAFFRGLGFEGEEIKGALMKRNVKASIGFQVKILMADRPHRESIAADIDTLIESMGLSNNVQLLDERGQTGDEIKLQKLIEDTKPTVLLFFIGKSTFTSPYVIKAAERSGVKLIIRVGAGYEGMHFENSVRYGIPLMRSHGLGLAVANYTLRLMFAGLRSQRPAIAQDGGSDISQDAVLKSLFELSPTDYDEALVQAASRKRGEMTPDQKETVFGPMSKTEFMEHVSFLEGKKVGILGFGVTAQDFVKKLNKLKELTGVNFDIIATSPALLDPESDRADAAKRLGVIPVDEQELFQTSDVLSIHILSSDVNRNYVSPGQFTGRKKPLILINTSRRDVVDDTLLTDQPFEVSYFADIDYDAPILALRETHPNKVFLTPHIAAMTAFAAEGVSAGLISTLESVLPVMLGRKSPESVQTLNGLPIRSEDQSAVVLRPGHGARLADVEQETAVRQKLWPVSAGGIFWKLFGTGENEHLSFNLTAENDLIFTVDGDFEGDVEALRAYAENVGIPFDTQAEMDGRKTTIFHNDEKNAFYIQNMAREKGVRFELPKPSGARLAGDFPSDPAVQREVIENFRALGIQVTDQTLSIRLSAANSNVHAVTLLNQLSVSSHLYDVEAVDVPDAMNRIVEFHFLSLNKKSEWFYSANEPSGPADVNQAEYDKLYRSLLPTFRNAIKTLGKANVTAKEARQAAYELSYAVLGGPSNDKDVSAARALIVKTARQWLGRDPETEAWMAWMLGRVLYADIEKSSAEKNNYEILDRLDSLLYHAPKESAVTAWAKAYRLIWIAKTNPEWYFEKDTAWKKDALATAQKLPVSNPTDIDNRLWAFLLIWKATAEAGDSDQQQIRSEILFLLPRMQQYEGFQAWASNLALVIAESAMDDYAVEITQPIADRTLMSKAENFNPFDKLMAMKNRLDTIENNAHGARLTQHVVVPHSVPAQLNLEEGLKVLSALVPEGEERIVNRLVRASQEEWLVRKRSGTIEMQALDKTGFSPLTDRPELFMVVDFRGEIVILDQLSNQEYRSTFSHFKAATAADVLQGARLTERVSEADLKSQIQFGTSGWRTDTGHGFTLGNVSRVAQAVAAVLLDEDPDKSWRVAVGYDARPGAREFAQRAVEVLIANGIHADLIDQVTPTPIMAESTRLSLPVGRRYDVALHLTASHNPVFTSIQSFDTWQGMKVLMKGVPAPDAFTARIAAVANDAERNVFYRRIPYDSIPEGLTTSRVDLVSASNQRLKKVFDFEKLKAQIAERRKNDPKFKDFSLIVDSMHGATADAAKILAELGVVEAHLNTDYIVDALDKGTLPRKAFDPSLGQEVPWRPEPQPFLHPELTALTKPGKFAAPLDGDGDRAAFIDIDGRTITPNEFGLVTLNYLYSQGERGAVVRTIPTTHSLDRFARLHSLSLYETPVGSKWFEPHATGKSEKLLVGIEESGHIFFKYKNEIFADSAVAEVLLALEIIVQTGKSLGENLKDIYAEQGELSYTRVQLDPAVADATFVDKLKRQRQTAEFQSGFAGALSDLVGKSLKLADGQPKDGVTYDLRDASGIKVNFADGTWMMYRVSGTDGSIRLYAEDASTEAALALAKKGGEALAQWVNGARLTTTRFYKPGVTRAHPSGKSKAAIFSQLDNHDIQVEIGDTFVRLTAKEENQRAVSNILIFKRMYHDNGVIVHDETLDGNYTVTFQLKDADTLQLFLESGARLAAEKERVEEDLTEENFGSIFRSVLGNISDTLGVEFQTDENVVKIWTTDKDNEKLLDNIRHSAAKRNVPFDRTGSLSAGNNIYSVELRLNENNFAFLQGLAGSFYDTERDALPYSGLGARLADADMIDLLAAPDFNTRGVGSQYFATKGEELIGKARQNPVIAQHTVPVSSETPASIAPLGAASAGIAVDAETFDRIAKAAGLNTQVYPEAGVEEMEFPTKLRDGSPRIIDLMKDIPGGSGLVSNFLQKSGDRRIQHVELWTPDIQAAATAIEQAGSESGLRPIGFANAIEGYRVYSVLVNIATDEGQASKVLVELVEMPKQRGARLADQAAADRKLLIDSLKPEYRGPLSYLRHRAATSTTLSGALEPQFRAFAAQLYALFPEQVRSSSRFAVVDSETAQTLVYQTRIESQGGSEILYLDEVKADGTTAVVLTLDNPRQAAQALKDNKALAKDNPAASVLLQKALLEKNVQVALEGSPSVISGTPRLVFSLGVYADIEHDSIFELALKQQAMALSKARQKYPQATFHILGKVSDSRQAIVQSVFSQLQGVSYEAPEDGVIISFDTPQSPAFKTDLDHVRLPVAQVKDNEVISWTSLLGLGLASAAVFSKDGKVDFKSTQATDSNLDRLVSAYRLESGTQIDSLTFVQIVSNKASLTTVLKYLLRPILPILDQALSVHQLITKVVGQAA